MAGVEWKGSRYTAWLLDTRTGRILRRAPVPLVDEYEADWKHGRFVIRKFGERKALAVLKP